MERWERLLPHYARSRRVDGRADGSLVVSFVARRPLIDVLGLGLPVTWRARTWTEPGDAAPALRPRRRGDPRDGRHVADRADRRRPDAASRSSTTSGRAVPFFAAFVDRAFTRPIAGRTLGTFKALAEALQAGGIATPIGPPA